MAKKKEKYLVIVESPAKSKTIGKILGPDYIIESSVGHIRDLPVRKTGVNTRKKFEPTYEIMPGKEKVVNKLTKLAKEVKTVYLATDPDREGEAIAWHLQEILELPTTKKNRVTFNEITKTAVQEAFENPTKINQPKVDAQVARRILDRLVGYKISPLIRRRIGGRSAGRVQSVAVRLICDREAEINAFDSQEYWSFDGVAEYSTKQFPLQLISWDKKRITNPDKVSDKNICINNKKDADAIVAGLGAPTDLEVKSITEREQKKKPSVPFVTSTIQRTAASAYGFGVKKTMQIAQQLYEGIDLYKDGNPVGLITYMRTDSTRVSPIAQEQAKEYITEKFGTEYLGTGNQAGKSKKSKTKEQDAHEAIRPSYIDKTPDSIKQVLTSDQYKLYKLIWERFMASQMAEAKFKRLTIELKDIKTDRSIFRTSSQKVLFKGYLAIWNMSEEQESEGESNKDANDELTSNKALPDLNKGDIVKLNNLLPKQHFTEPPPRFNEASLVKTLEELGVGRPSTYAATISTIQDREYVVKNDSKALAPTKLGQDVNNVLLEYFTDIVNAGFTASMEDKLDKVEQKKLQWQEMLHEFYEPFKKVLKEAQEQIAAISIETDHDCPKCDAKMVQKNSFYGPFLACSNYPECDATVKLTKDGNPVPPPRPSETDCPKCTTKMEIVYGRYGEYLKCPEKECAHQMPIIHSLDVPCPKDGCEGEIIEKKSRFGKIFYGCSEYSNTKCDAVYWNFPLVEEKCPDCGSTLTYKFLKRGDKIACPDTKGCGYARLADEKEKEKYTTMINEKSKK